jgi:hypothetical protein
MLFQGRCRCPGLRLPGHRCTRRYYIRTFSLYYSFIDRLANIHKKIGFSCRCRQKLYRQSKSILLRTGRGCCRACSSRGRR